MNEKDVKPFINKRVKLRLKTGYFYSGKITSTSESALRFRDKFETEMLIAFDNIALIEELNEALE